MIQSFTAKRIAGINKSYCLNKFSRSYSFCKLRLLVGILTFVYHFNIYLKNLCNTRMFVNTTTFFLDQNMIKCALFFENISLQPKLSNILIFQTFKKCGFLSENHKLKIFEEVSTLVEYSIHPQNFFLNSKLTFKHFYFLNHVNSTKIEKNIYPSDPPLNLPF